MLAKRVGDHIRAMREARGWSLERLAAKLPHDGTPVHYTTLGKLESGKRGMTIEWVERIAMALGVDPVQLITGSRPGDVAQFTLDEQVANEIARSLAAVVLDGAEPDAGTVQVVSLMLQELTETFSKHPQAYHDPNVARPLTDLIARKSAHAVNSH